MLTVYYNSTFQYLCPYITTNKHSINTNQALSVLVCLSDVQSLCYIGQVTQLLLQLEKMEEEKKLEIVERDEDLEDQVAAAEVQSQPWREQITLRGVFVSMMIGIIYSIIVMKLNLTTGMVPNLNVSAALLAFVFVRTWTKVLSKAGIVAKPFSRQENTIIQTCAVACYSIAVGG